MSAQPTAPLIAAHRGAWGPAPENSLDAFARAIELGCDMVELDVRRTRDRRLVVFHDARVRGAAVGALDYETLRRRAGGEQPPLLEEVLDLVAGRIRADIELKEAGYVDEALGLIQARLDLGMYVITSVIDDVLCAIRESAPDTVTGLIVRVRRPLGSGAGRAGLDMLVPHVSLIRAGILDWCVERGLGCLVWTVNDARRLRSLLADPRVHGVVTDRPAEALAIRDFA